MFSYADSTDLLGLGFFFRPQRALALFIAEIKRNKIIFLCAFFCQAFFDDARRLYDHK